MHDGPQKVKISTASPVMISPSKPKGEATGRRQLGALAAPLGGTTPSSVGLFKMLQAPEMSERTLRLQLDLTTPGALITLKDDPSSLEASYCKEIDTSSEKSDDSGVDEKRTQFKHLSLETSVIFENAGSSGSETSLPPAPIGSRALLGNLVSVLSFEGALFYIHNGCIEKAILEQVNDVDFSIPTQLSQAPENASILSAQRGVPSYLTWDNCSTHADRAIILEENDSLARPVHKSIQGTVVGLKSFSDSIHCWTMQCTDIGGTSCGIVSKVGVYKFRDCKMGSMPHYVACLQPGTRLEHRIHWHDHKGRERWKVLDPPLSHFLKADGVNELSVVLNFCHRDITFLCNDSVIGKVSFQNEPCTMLLGDHTVFTHLKHGASVKLVRHIYRWYRPSHSAIEGIARPKFFAGNPYARWGHLDGIGPEAAFKMPLGMCEWKGYLWLTDCNVIRRVDMKGHVETFHPNLQPAGCQPDIQYLGAIHAMRNKLYAVDLTNRTILCIDPKSWEARPVMQRGVYGFYGTTEEQRKKLSDVINEMRTYDLAVSLLCPAMEQVVSKSSCVDIDGIPSGEFPPYRLVGMSLAHVAPAWLFVTDSDSHCLFYADLAQGRANAATRGVPRICAGAPNEPGRADGQGTDAQFRYPTAIAGDVENLLFYVADTGNNRLAKVQLVWNEIRRDYSAQVSTLYHVLTTEKGEETIKLKEVNGLTVYNETASCLLVCEPGSDLMYQVHLQASIKGIGQSFASPYDQLAMMLKQSRREAENMPQVNVEHCKNIGRALDLLMSTPNIYQVEYVGGALDDDVARFLSDTYAPQGIGWEENESEEGELGRTISVLRRRTSVEKTIQASAVTGNAARFEDGPSKALGLDIHGLDSIDFNVFETSRMCEDSGGVLVQVAMNIFSKYRFFPKFFGTPEQVHRLIQFLSKVQAGYHRENHYHNHIHAADVLQTVHWMINKSGIANKITDTDCLGILLAAIVHDYDHPGVNNAFLVNTRDDIALHFNDQSVLENHHLFLTFQLLRVETYQVLDTLSDHEQRIIREGMINHVLGTDMKVHFRSLGELKARAQALKDENSDFMSTTDDKMLMLKAILHASDISNPVKCKKLYLDWTKRVMKEFREQGKREEELEISVSPFCDKDADVAKCQKGFIEFVVRPLFTVLAEVYTDFKPMIDNLEANLSHWKDMDGPVRTSSFRRRRSSIL